MILATILRGVARVVDAVAASNRRKAEREIALVLGRKRDASSDRTGRRLK